MIGTGWSSSQIRYCLCPQAAQRPSTSQRDRKEIFMIYTADQNKTTEANATF